MQLANIGKHNAEYTNHRAVQCEGIQLTKRQTGRTAERTWNNEKGSPVREEPKRGKSESEVEEETGGQEATGIAGLEEG